MIVDWPSEPGLYKVVQVNLGDEIHLRFGEFSSRHTDILESFLKSKDIKYSITSGFPLVEQKGDDYEATAMCVCDLKENKAYFERNSSDYRLSATPLMIDEIRASRHDLEIILS